MGNFHWRNKKRDTKSKCFHKMVKKFTVPIWDHFRCKFKWFMEKLESGIINF